MLLLENEFTADEAQARFPELLERAARGEEIRITQAGIPTACLMPWTVESTQAERDEAFRVMREIADRNTLGGIRIKDLIDEGRR